MCWSAILALAVQAGFVDDMVSLEGRVRLFARDGHEIPEPSGTFQLRVCVGVSHLRPVEFEKGRYETRIPRSFGWLEVYGARTPLGSALIDTDLVYRDENWTGTLDLTGWLVEPCTLRVLDAATLEPLDCVDVSSPCTGRPLVPDLYGMDGAGIEIDPLFGEEEFLRQTESEWGVHAAGYADVDVELTPRLGGTRVVLMERAGSLELVLANFRSTRHTFLEIESLESDFEDRGHVDTRRALRFERLRPGPYVVRVVHEFLDLRRTVLCEKVVHVAAEATTCERLFPAPTPHDDTDGPWEPLELQGAR